MLQLLFAAYQYNCILGAWRSSIIAVRASFVIILGTCRRKLRRWWNEFLPLLRTIAMVTTSIRNWNFHLRLVLIAIHRGEVGGVPRRLVLGTNRWCRAPRAWPVWSCTTIASRFSRCRIHRRILLRSPGRFICVLLFGFQPSQPLLSSPLLSCSLLFLGAFLRTVW